MKIVDCYEQAKILEAETAKTVSVLSYRPCLAVLMVGKDEASDLYVKRKREACARVGITSICSHLSENTSIDEVLDTIDFWNMTPDIDAILVQLPLPNHLNKIAIIQRIDPMKDVDGFHPLNIGKLAYNEETFVSCTSLGVMKFLEILNIKILGKNFVIINNSTHIGLPLSLILSNLGATVIICNRYTRNLKEISRKADVIVTAVGKRPFFVLNNEFVQENAVVVDVGINKIEGKVYGDVDIDSLKDIPGIVSKVPGSIGLLVVQMLLKNTIICAKASRGTFYENH